jgi:BirA family biotin operon repressor/biotin-[acetyl-CoA-carboxylase] ligase
VAASLAFEADWPVRRRGLIPLVAGLAARQALGSPVRLKWPNDLVVGELKVGGILVEAVGDVVVAGVGVNLWWPDPIEGAGALLGADPGPEAADWIADHWASALLERLAAGPDRWGRAEYLEACLTLGARVLAGEAGPGVASDIGDDGSLLVATDDGSIVAVSEPVGAAPLQA